MAEFDQTFSTALAQLHTLDFDYNDGNGSDFEPYGQFQPADDNASWIRAWTGNKSLDGAAYRVFGQDGTGGYAMFWIVRPGADLLDQPIVFFGSEGELGVIACNFGDYAWLLASGIGPLEAVSYPTTERAPVPAFAEFARSHGYPERSRADVLARAAAEFPSFEADVRASRR